MSDHIVPIYQKIESIVMAAVRHGKEICHYGSSDRRDNGFYVYVDEQTFLAQLSINGWTITRCLVLRSPVVTNLNLLEACKMFFDAEKAEKAA